MRVTKAIREYIEDQVKLKTKPQLDDIEAQIKKWNDGFDVQEQKFKTLASKEITKFASALYPKLKKAAPKDTTFYLSYSWNSSENKTTLEDFIEDMLKIFDNKIRFNYTNPYVEKKQKFLNLREQKVAEIILQLELGAKREELQEMLSNITIEV